jgi:hypothetical protein
MTRSAIQAVHVLEADSVLGHVDDCLGGIEQETHDNRLRGRHRLWRRSQTLTRSIWMGAAELVSESRSAKVSLLTRPAPISAAANSRSFSR